MMGYVRGTWLIVRFFLAQLAPLQSIVTQMPSVGSLDPKQSLRLVLDRAPGQQYAKALETLQQQLRGLTGKGPNFRTVMISLVLIRLVSIGCAYIQLPMQWVLLVSGAAQFAVAPYSLVVCFCRFLVNAQVIAVCGCLSVPHFHLMGGGRIWWCITAAVC